MKASFHSSFCGNHFMLSVCNCFYLFIFLSGGPSNGNPNKQTNFTAEWRTEKDKRLLALPVKQGFFVSLTETQSWNNRSALSYKSWHFQIKCGKKGSRRDGMFFETGDPDSQLIRLSQLELLSLTWTGASEYIEAKSHRDAVLSLEYQITATTLQSIKISHSWMNQGATFTPAIRGCPRSGLRSGKTTLVSCLVHFGFVCKSATGGRERN